MISDVYLVFDRYWEYSTKSTTRSGRSTEASSAHKLNLDTPLPHKKSVIADDTDVFILLIHHYLEQKLTNFMVMESPIHGRSVIGIFNTVNNEEHIAHDLLACHALSGRDTVVCYFGIGKV